MPGASLGIPPECMAKTWKKKKIDEKDAKKDAKKRRKNKSHGKKTEKRHKKDAKRCKIRQLTPLCLFFTEIEIDSYYYIQLLLLLLEGSTQWSVVEWCEVSLSHSKKPFVKWQGCSKTNRCYTLKQFRSTTLMSCCTLSEIPNILPVYLFSTVTDH